jgi:hypothetical protein
MNLPSKLILNRFFLVDGVSGPLAIGTPHLCGSQPQAEKVKCSGFSRLLPHKCGVPAATSTDK